MEINPSQCSTARNRGFKFITRFATAFALLLGASFTAEAVTWNGSAADNAWDNVSNWDGNPSGGLASVNSANNYPIITSTTTLVPNDINIADADGTTGRVDVRSGTLNYNYWSKIGDYSGNATLNIADTLTTGGTYTGFGLGSGSYVSANAAGNASLFVGLYQSTGVINMNTTGSLDAQNLWVSPNGAAGSGTFNLDSGSVNLSGTLVVGSDYWGAGAAPADFNMSGGTVNVGGITRISHKNASTGGASQITVSGGTLNSENDLNIGYAGNSSASATLTIAGSGVVNVGSATTRWVTVNYWDGMNGTLMLTNGGTMNLHAGTDIQFAPGNNSGTRVLTVDGGTINGTAAGGSFIDLNRAAGGGTGTMNITNGGLVAVDAIVGGANTTLNFDNGTLKATASDASFIGGDITSVNILSGGATLDSNGKNPIVVAGMAGSGGVTKTGNGTLTMNGVNTYTGTTTVSQGSLGGTGTIAGLLSVGSGAGINLQNGTAGTLTVGGGLTLTSGNSLTFEVGATADRIAITGGSYTAPSTAAPVNIVNLAGMTAGIYKLLTGAAGVSLVDFSLTTTPPTGYSYTLQVTGNDLELAVGLVSPAAAFWKGGVSGVWNAADSGADFNWATDDSGASSTVAKPGLPTDVTFSATGAANENTTLGENFSINSLTFDASAGSVSVDGSGETLTVAAGIINNSANPQSINVPVILGAAQTIDAASGDVAMGSTIANGGNTLSVAGANDTTFTAAVSGSGGLTKQGAGTLSLSGANTYTGMTLASGGTLNVTGTIPGPAQTIVGNADGTASLAISGSLTANEFVIGNNDAIISPLATTGVVSMTSGSVTSTDWLIVGRQGGNGTFNQSGGTVTHSGVGRLVVGWHWQSGKEGTTGSYNMSGNAVLNANDTGESLSVGDSAGDAGTMVISDNATVTSAASIYVGNYGAGVLTLTNSADVNITGSLRVGERSGASGTVTMAGGTVDMTGGLVLGRYSGNTSAQVTVSGGTMTVGEDSAIGHQGTGTLTIASTGTFVEPANKWLLLGAGGGHGTIHLDGGTLQVRHIETYGTGTVNLNGGTIQINSASDPIFDGDITTYVKAGGAVIDTAGFDKTVGSDLLEDVVSTGGGLVKNGAGTLRLNGVNTYTGSTEVNAGTLGGTGTIAGALNVNSSGTLAPGASIGTLTLGGALTFNSGAAASFEINKSGLTLTSDHIAGATSITAGGTLDVSATGDALTAGDAFALFNMGVGSGWFSGVTLPALDAGLSWDTNHLATTGVLDVYHFSTTPLTISMISNTTANIAAPKMAAQASSSKAAAVALAASAPSHGTATISAGALTYTPATDFVGGDSFTVTFSDGHGSQTMAVSVTVNAQNTGPSITPTSVGGKGSFTASGIPGVAYIVQLSTDLSAWSDYAATTAAANGLISYTDTVTIEAHGGTVYFRLKQQ